MEVTIYVNMASTETGELFSVINYNSGNQYSGVAINANMVGDVFVYAASSEDIKAYPNPTIGVLHW